MTRSLLDRVFSPGALAVRFEPVVDVAQNPIGCGYVEGLVSGPRGTNLEAADVLFSYIRHKRESARMDRLCVSTILTAAAAAVPAEVAIGLNVDAATLATDPGFPVYLANAAAGRGISPRRLVAEIVEHTWPDDLAAFRAGMSALREMGIRIALDDVGRAHSNYRLMLETRPDFFKIDRLFVAGAHGDPRRRDVIRSIASLARSFGARVVAEGVEQAADLDCVRGLGIELAQGYLFRRIPNPPQTRRNVHVEEHGYR